MVESAKDFYLSVINEVVEKNRQQFISEGVSEDVLEKMKKIWIEKINAKLAPENDSRYHDYQHYGGHMYRESPYGHYGYNPHYYPMGY
jgi:hypothetical protein